MTTFENSIRQIEVGLGLLFLAQIGTLVAVWFLREALKSMLDIQRGQLEREGRRLDREGAALDESFVKAATEVSHLIPKA